MLVWPGALRHAFLRAAFFIRHELPVLTINCYLTSSNENFYNFNAILTHLSWSYASNNAYRYRKNGNQGSP